MLQNHEGQTVPQVIFPTRIDSDWVNLTTDEIFKDKTVVLFSLPGAYTPTCSSTHLPRYNQMASTFKKLGVDDIICLSVNDSFVMNQWKQEQQADNIQFLADGNGDFTRGMGMLVPKNDLGFGDRSWRYSMLVKNGVIEKMFIEPDLPGDPFEVSDADTMLNFMAPDVEPPKSITVFTRPGCPFCVKAKEMLNNANMGYDELVLNKDFTESTIRAVSGTSSVPQVFIDGALIGGSDELAEYLRTQTDIAA